MFLHSQDKIIGHNLGTKRFFRDEDAPFSIWKNELHWEKLKVYSKSVQEMDLDMLILVLWQNHNNNKVAKLFFLVNVCSKIILLLQWIKEKKIGWIILLFVASNVSAQAQRIDKNSCSRENFMRQHVSNLKIVA